MPDDPRPGALRSIGDDYVDAVIARTLDDEPADATHWSTRDLAAKAGMSPSGGSGGVRVEAVAERHVRISEDPQFRRQGPRCRRLVHEPS